MSNLTTIFNDADRLRAYFMERGWSIHMEDNGRSVIDPFATIIEAVQGAAIAAQMRAAFDEGIEAEAAQGTAPSCPCDEYEPCAEHQSEGAAPRAEGLDFDRLVGAMHAHTANEAYEHCGGLCADDIADEYRRLAPQERRDKEARS